MHNYYTYLYNQTVHDVISAKKGEKEAILFARSATAGGQKFPVHWGDSLLVAPIFNDQSMAEYYLPAGTWTSVLTGEARQGGKWYRGEARLSEHSAVRQGKQHPCPGRAGRRRGV